MAGGAALLAALAPGARLLLHLALAPEHRLRQHRPGRAELRKLGFQRLGAAGQRRPLGLQCPHLGAPPSVLPAQRHDHIRRPRGRRPQPVVALAQPRDGAIPGPHQPRGRRAPPVELLAQRGDLAVVPVRRLAERSAQPVDVLVQPIDLVAMPGLDPLLVGVGPPQKVAETVDLAVQESNPALLVFRPPHVLLQPSVLLPQRRDRLLGVPRSPVSRARPGLRRRRGVAQTGDLHAQGHDRAALARLDAGLRKQLLQPRHFALQGKGVLRRAADFLRLRLGRLQLAPALVELRLQRTRPASGVQLRSAQFFAARFRRLRPRPFSLVPRTQVPRLARRRRRLGRRPSLGNPFRRRQTRANILVENRHAPDGSAWPDSLPAKSAVVPSIPRPPNAYGFGRAVEAGGFCGRQAPKMTEAVISSPPVATWIHRLRVRFQSFLRVRSQMSFFGWARFVWRSYRPRPWVVPTRIQPDAL